MRENYDWYGPEEKEMKEYLEWVYGYELKPDKEPGFFVKKED